MKVNSIILIIIFFTGLCSLFTVNGTHSWGDDFAMYLMHADNIANGETYNETGFIYNDLAPTYAPQSYPPGFPLLLAPFESLFKDNYFAYKVYILFYFLLFLWLIYYYFKDKVSNVSVIGIVCLIAFCPFIFQFRDHILADIPGAATLFAALIFFERAIAKKEIALWLLTGCLFYLSFSIRSTAIVLIPMAGLHLLIKKPEGWFRVAYAILAFVILHLVTGLVFKQDSNYYAMFYASYVGLTTDDIIWRINYFVGMYYNEFNQLFIYNFHNLFVNDVVVLLGKLLFILGFLVALYKRHAYNEMLFVFYTVLILAWPGYQGMRYFLPLLPFYFYYVAYGLEQIKKPAVRITVQSVFAVFAMATFISYYSSISYKPVTSGVTGPASTALFDFIEDNIPDSATIMSAKPRAICLITHRNGIVFPDPDFRHKLEYSIKANGVDYLILNTPTAYPNYAQEVVKKDTVNYPSLFMNEEWAVYRVNYAAID